MSNASSPVAVITALPQVNSANLRFDLLDIVRGLAAVWVLTFHSQFSEAFRGALPWLHHVTRAGYLGVEVFFVVSGYCVTAAAMRGLAKNESVKTFLYRRLHRIYPPFWCSIVVVVSLPWLKSLWLGARSDGAEPLYAGFLWYDWVMIASLAQAYRFPDLPLHHKFANVNIVYWTMALEVQFYLVTAAAYASRKWFWAVVLGLGILAVPWSVAGAPTWLNTGCFLPYWPNFVLGSLVYLAHSAGWTWAWPFGRRAAIAGGATAGLIGSAMAGYLALGGRPPSLTFAGIVAVGLWCLLPVDAELRRRGLNRSRWLVPWFGLGAMSYSLYLIHFNLQKLPRLVLYRLLPAESIILDICTVMATVACCIPFYWICERSFVTRATMSSTRQKHGYTPRG